MSGTTDSSNSSTGTSCEFFEASIAASLYEPLPDAERKHLDAHLAQCGTCRETEAALRTMTQEIPVAAVTAEVDLWPALQARTASRRGSFHWSLYAAAAVFFVVIGANVARVTISTPQGAAPIAGVSGPVAQALERASSFQQEHDFAGALKTLQTALATHPKDVEAGNAQAMLAELEFGHGQRYAEAYAAYAALKEKYPQAWAANPRNADRFDLLTETKAAKFQPLYDLAAAKSSGTDAFGQLEKIAAKPDSFLIGALAVDAMRELVGGTDTGAGAGKVAALQQVRERCTDPVAAAQVKLALADAHWSELHDAATARGLYDEVAQGPQPLAAKAARAALAKLDAR